MICTFHRCGQRSDRARGVWTDEDTARIRAQGWFVYAKNAPPWFKGEAIAGMALCPRHHVTEEGKRLVALHDEAIGRTAEPPRESKGMVER